MPTIKLLLRPQVLLPVFLILLLTLVSSLYHRSMHIDDAWLAEYAWWFSQTGHTKSEMFRGFEHYETQIWVYHKFFIIEGAALIRFFGIDLYILKSMSIFYMIE